MVEDCNGGEYVINVQPATNDHTASSDSRYTDIGHRRRRQFLRPLAWHRTSRSSSSSPASAADPEGESETDEDRNVSHAMLRKLFDSLTRKERNAPLSFMRWRTPATMDKDSFLRLFPQLPGVVGERLYAAFDKDGNGVIDFEEFLHGLTVIGSANLDKKLRFLFNMYDLNGDGFLSKDEITMMLLHIPESITFLTNIAASSGEGQYRRKDRTSTYAAQPGRYPLTRVDRRSKTVAASVRFQRSISSSDSDDDLIIEDQRPTTSDVEEPPHISHEVSNELEVLVRSLVDRAFRIFDPPPLPGKRPSSPHTLSPHFPDKKQLMNFDTFCEAVCRFSDLRIALEVFCRETIKPSYLLPMIAAKDRGNTPTTLSGIGLGAPTSMVSTTSIGSAVKIPDDRVTKFESPRGRSGCVICGDRLVQSPSDQSSTTTKKRKFGSRIGRCERCSKFGCLIEEDGHMMCMVGWLERDKFLHSSRRLFILRDRFLYAYRHSSDTEPVVAFLIAGCIVDKLWNENSARSHELPPSFDDNTPPPAVSRLDQTVHPSTPAKFPTRTRAGLEIWIPDTKVKLRVYADTQAERDLWVEALSKASQEQAVSFHDIYLLDYLVGKGKFASVFAASKKVTGERVAVKILRRPQLQTKHTDSLQLHRRRKKWRTSMCGCGRSKPHVPSDDYDEEEEDQAALIEFQRTEVAILRLLDHKNLIRLVDVFLTNEFVYLVMDWTSGSDLRKLLEMIRVTSLAFDRVSTSSRRAPFRLWIPEWIVKELARGILQGLRYLHSKSRNVIHRDLKPGNVIFTLGTTNLKAIIHRCFRSPSVILPSFRVESGIIEILPTAPITKLSTRSTRAKTSTPMTRSFGLFRPSVSSSLSSSGDEREPMAAPLSTSPGALMIRNDTVLAANELLNLWLFVHFTEWFLETGQQPPKDRRAAKALTIPPTPSGMKIDHMPPEDKIVLHRNFVAQMAEVVTSIEESPEVSTMYGRIVSMATNKGVVHPQITDFGLSKIISPPSSSTVGGAHSPEPKNVMTAYASEALGTAAYAAPEVLAGLQYTTSADMWSLGIMLFQLMSGGQLPSFATDGTAFDEQRRNHLVNAEVVFEPQERWANVTVDCKRFIQRLLAFDPATRTCAEKALGDPWLCSGAHPF